MFLERLGRGLMTYFLSRCGDVAALGSWRIAPQRVGVRFGRCSTGIKLLPWLAGGSRRVVPDSLPPSAAALPSGVAEYSLSCARIRAYCQEETQGKMLQGFAAGGRIGDPSRWKRCRDLRR